MARIAGINLVAKKRLATAILAITGIGRSLAIKICRQANIEPSKRCEELTEEEEARLRNEVAKVMTEGDLRRDIQQNIKLLQDIGSYRGHRHAKRLPARGQRTKTNARTRRGKKITMGSGRRKEEKK